MPALFETPRWGEASPRRGLSHRETAEQFIIDFPIGTVLTIDEFDNWCVRHGLLPAITLLAQADKKSDAWKARLMRRHEQKKFLNDAGSHPRMADNGFTPFFIARQAHQQYIVRAPQDEAMQGRLPQKIQTLTRYHRAILDTLLQSPNYNTLPPDVKSFAEQGHFAIETFVAVTNSHAVSLMNQMRHLQSKLAAAGWTMIVDQSSPATEEPATDEPVDIGDLEV